MSYWNKEFDRYVGHYSRHQNKCDFKTVADHRVCVVDADIGRAVDFERLAPHHVIVPPNCRTSFPHAESLEEEFVFVLSGTPKLWFNGYIYDLKEGHAVGFPSGTGDGHSFINNTSSEIHLLVVGERTKSGNRWIYPVNPELRESCKAWWDDAPRQTLGPHNGLPGSVGGEAAGSSLPDCVVLCPSVPRRKPFHYPGDNEGFGEGFRISDKVGLNKLGIWYERLPPGRRSAFPHAHTHEEEFVYVVQGRPTIWMDGFTKVVEAGYFTAFPSGTGIAHAIINDTSDEIIYICVGESQEFPDEKILYPLNRLRQRECQRKGWYWSNAPQRPNGDAPARSKCRSNQHLEFRHCEESMLQVVFGIYQGSAGYFHQVDGCAPTIEMAKKSLEDGPKESSENYFKEFLLIYLDDNPVGVLDLHANHPEPGICYIGLLLLKEELWGKGLGSSCYQLAEDYIKRALDCRKIRLGISESNAVSGFWMKQGFSRSGKTYHCNGELKENIVHEFEKIVG